MREKKIAVLNYRYLKTKLDFQWRMILIFTMRILRMYSELTKKIKHIAIVSTFIGSTFYGVANASEVIKIGVPTGLSGANSVVAPAVVQSSELAIEEINAAGGILGHTVELVVADDGSGAAGAQKAFDFLIFQEEVDVLISMETSAARNGGLPIVTRGQTPYILSLIHI